MLKALEDISATKKRLKIEIPADRIEKEIRTALLDVQRRSRIPGFRPGKAPMSIIERKFGKTVESEVLEKIVPEHYMMALKEADVVPVAEPVVDESTPYEKDVPMSMTLTVEVRPKIEDLSYEGIAVTDMPQDVTDEEVQAALQRLAEEKASYEPVDEPVAPGDLVTVDYTVADEGTVTKDTVIKIGSGPYPQEFFDGLIGKRKDERADIEASFPDDSPTPFAGKRVRFDITVKDVKRRDVPPHDDELAKDLGLETIDQLKEKVRENILASKGRAEEGRKKRQILDALLGKHDLEVPEGVLNARIEGIIAEMRAKSNDERPDEALREEIRPDMEKSMKASIILELIAEREGIKVTDDDMKMEILTLSQAYYMTPENIMKYYMARDGSLEGLKRTLLERKTLDLLLGKATIEKGEQA
ncbi:MAG TPA: trigger factor [Dissulfurispiraceae bacterium]|nr:trigger factor [Dissulfurispiraceae bacterium]